MWNGFHNWQWSNPTAAGIDVSDTEMMVAYPINSEQLEIRAFGCFTRDLHLLANCLKGKGITTIAMESTGVYWVALFLLLQEYGFEVYLVNAKHVKNVTGRKDDESDAEWIQKITQLRIAQCKFPARQYDTHIKEHGTPPKKPCPHINLPTSTECKRHWN